MPVEYQDPRLTALVLGELTDRERAALEAEVAREPELAESVERLRETAAALRQELAAEGCPHLTAAQREHVLGEIGTAGATPAATVSGGWSALLASVGWGSWGAWLLFASAVILVSAGLAAWHVLDRNDNPPKTGVDATAGAGEETGTGRGRGAARGTDREVALPPLITLRVGESLPLRVLGRVTSGREAELAPDQLVWSTEPLAGFLDFDANTLTLTGVAVTPQPVRLTVRMGDLKAEARVRVIRTNNTRGQEREDGRDGVSR